MPISAVSATMSAAALAFMLPLPGTVTIATAMPMASAGSVMQPERASIRLAIWARLPPRTRYRISSDS